MPARGRHIIAGAAWVIGSSLAWVMACDAFAFVFFKFLGKRPGVTLSDGMVTALNWTVIAGLVLVPATIAMLAVRAYLPGTGTRPSKTRGFPIEETRRPGPS